jgi:hypothetical protein
MDPPGPVPGAPREDIQPATASQAFVTLEFAKEGRREVRGGACAPAAYGFVARRPPVGADSSAMLFPHDGYGATRSDGPAASPRCNSGCANTAPIITATPR